MNPIELLRHATDAVRAAHERGSKHEAMIQLTMVRERRPTGSTVRMFGTQGPKGDICLVKPQGEAWMVVATFPAAQTARWIAGKAEEALRESQSRAPDGRS